MRLRATCTVYGFSLLPHSLRHTLHSPRFLDLRPCLLWPPYQPQLQYCQPKGIIEATARRKATARSTARMIIRGVQITGSYGTQTLTRAVLNRKTYKGEIQFLLKLRVMPWLKLGRL